MFQVSPGPIEEILAVLEYWDHIFSGFLMTMWLYGWAILIGFFLGLFLAILRQYKSTYPLGIISDISAGFIEIVRGTPLIAQLLLLYFLPFSLNLPIENWSFSTTFMIFDKEITLILLSRRVLTGIIVLGLNSSAYQAEYFRGAIMSVGSGQLMAAQSVGMSRFSGIRHIIVPQALRRVIPAWSNEAAYLPKYTVIVYIIGVEELFAEAHWIVARTFISLTTYIIIALIFLVLITLISKLLDIVHKRTAIPGL
jgi:polar amino acid transport system permease protein